MNYTPVPVMLQVVYNYVVHFLQQYRQAQFSLLCPPRYVVSNHKFFNGFTFIRF